MSFSSNEKQSTGARPQVCRTLTKENSVPLQIIFRWKPLLEHCVVWALARKRSTGEVGRFLWYQLCCGQSFMVRHKVKVLKVVDGGMFYAKRQAMGTTKREVAIANSHHVT